jgi:hypothetical protein
MKLLLTIFVLGLGILLIVIPEPATTAIGVGLAGLSVTSFGGFLK